MRVYEKIVINIATGIIVEEQSYNYEGPVIRLDGGGGGSSGEVDFPDYMKTVHNDWLDNTGLDTLTSSVTDIMNVALGVGGNPFTSKTAFDPSTRLSSTDTDLATYFGKIDTQICEFDAFVDAMNFITDWQNAIAAAETKIDTIIDTTYIDAEINAYSDQLEDTLDNSVIPAFQGGLRDIGASMTSAFVVGESIIRGMKQRDVAKYSAELRNKFQILRLEMIDKATERMLKDLNAIAEFEKGVALAAIDGYGKVSAGFTVEANRIAIVAEKEETDANLRISEGELKWDLEVFQYGANVLASIQGGTSRTGGQPSTTQSMVGGALSGAAIGAQIGGGWGALAGGLLGLGAAVL